MLVQQFYNNPKYAEFLNTSFIVYRASRGDKIGDTIYEKFKVNATPTELFVDKDGKEVDWIVGYGPPADKFLEKLQKVLTGEETYRTLSARYAKEPKNVEVLFKLAKKCSSRYDDKLTAQAKELYQQVIALDPEGKAGSYTDDSLKAQIPYVQGAEFALGQMAAIGGAKSDPAPLEAFIKKYPSSPLVKNGYSYLTYYYQSQAPKDAATKFFEDYTAKYPDNKDALAAYVERIIRDKEPVDKGIALAEKLKELQGYPRNPEYLQNLAQLYIIKGDPAKADEEYGKDFYDNYLSTTVYALTGYANFWADQGKNQESVEAAADLAAKMAPPSQWYTRSTVAGIYNKLKKPEKALAVFGPEFIKSHGDDQNILSSYASFWSRQGSNLDSALEAARKSVALTSDYYNNYILANILFKMKKYTEALPYAEKAVEQAKAMAVKYPGFSIQQYEKLVKDIKEAIAKEKTGVAK